MDASTIFADGCHLFKMAAMILPKPQTQMGGGPQLNAPQINKPGGQLTTPKPMMQPLMGAQKMGPKPMQPAAKPMQMMQQPSFKPPQPMQSPPGLQRQPGQAPQMAQAGQIPMQPLAKQPQIPPVSPLKGMDVAPPTKQPAQAPMPKGPGFQDVAPAAKPQPTEQAGYNFETLPDLPVAQAPQVQGNPLAPQVPGAPGGGFKDFMGRMGNVAGRVGSSMARPYTDTARNLYNAAQPAVSSMIEAGQGLYDDMAQAGQDVAQGTGEGPTLGTADGSIPDITQASPGEVAMSQMSPEEKAQAARALYNQGKGMFQNVAGMAGRGLSSAGNWLQGFDPNSQPKTQTQTAQVPEGTAGATQTTGQPGEPAAPQEAPYPDSRFHEQLAYWDSIHGGDVGGKSTRGNVINERMKDRAGRMINYYKGLESRGDRTARMAQARVDAGQPISDAESNYLARREQFEGGHDPNAFNSNRDVTSEGILQHGLDMQRENAGLPTRGYA